MKLEGKVAIRHSNVGLEPESQAFVFIDDDQASDGCKLQNQKVKEYENEVHGFLENNKQGLDSPQYDMESADCMKNEDEAKVKDIVEPVSHSSKDMESFMKFPNDAESVKRSPTSPISNSAERRDLSRNSVDGYMDKTVTECEPHLGVCYKESDYHVIKDICVDEVFLNKDKVMFVNTIDEKAHNFFPSESYENKEKQKDNTSINVLSLTPTEENAHNFFPSDSYENKEKQKDNTSINLLSLTPTKESDKVSANHDHPKDSMHEDEEATEEVSGNVNKEMPLPEEMVLLPDFLAVDSDDKGEQISNEPELYSQLEDSKNTVEEATLASYFLALEDDESNNDNKLSENGSFTDQLDLSAPADCGKVECHQAGVCKCVEFQHPMKLIAEGKSDDLAVGSIRHSLGEASFSAVDPMSGRISYSGPVPYSGSISLRSDSSTTSTRSFAFPIIQSEWNSSPVRMAKADRTNYRKRRCWGHRFLCCKF